MHTQCIAPVQRAAGVAHQQPLYWALWQHVMYGVLMLLPPQSRSVLCSLLLASSGVLLSCRMTHGVLHATMLKRKSKRSWQIRKLQS